MSNDWSEWMTEWLVVCVMTDWLTDRLTEQQSPNPSKSSQNRWKWSPKSSENRWKWRPGLVPRALGRALGGMLAPKARLSQIEEACCQKLSHFWVRIWGSIFKLLRDFWIRFCDLFSRLRFGSYKYRFWKDFGRFLASVLEGFRYSFLDRWEVSEMSFRYIIYYVWSTSASWKIRRNSYILATWSVTFLKMATDSVWSSILGGFGVRFGRLFGGENRKKWSPKKHWKTW